MTPTIQDLVTPESVEAYHATADKWLFAHDELDAAGIPSTEANIDALETALNSSWQPADDLIDATECMTTDEYLAHLETEA